MSENKIGNFVKGHKKAEIAVGVGAAAAAAAFGMRKKRHHELHTFSDSDLTDRLKVFRFSHEETAALNDHTVLAGKIYGATANGENGGINLRSLAMAAESELLDDTESVLKDLMLQGFVTQGKLSDGSEGFTATPDLVKAVMDGLSEPLSQYFYDQR